MKFHIQSSIRDSACGYYTKRKPDLVVPAAYIFNQEILKELRNYGEISWLRIGYNWNK
jgi:hypothetical protein